ncbi:hypothetical protein [Methyloversatilis discipulorum]|uniref:hypothetical protein n=1 Tax=Methyloversatilis discipulorum TaxID=1119528 RepID=UPI0026F0D90A|nr:hypothetical protein [Methyloversatilis discipulorum]
MGVLVADTPYARIAAAPLAWRDGRFSSDLQHHLTQASWVTSDFAQNQLDYLQSAFNFMGPLLALTPALRVEGE